MIGHIRVKRQLFEKSSNLLSAKGRESLAVSDGRLLLSLASSSSRSVTSWGSITTGAIVSSASATVLTSTFATTFTSSTAASRGTTAGTTTRLSWLLLEGVVDVEDLLLRSTLSFSLGLLLTDEIGFFFLFFGEGGSVLPLLVILSTLVGSSGFLETQTFKLLLSLLLEVLSV